MSAVLDSVYERAPTKASGGKYWSKRWRTDHRVYIAAPPKSKWSTSRGGFSTDTLTSLDEVYAPKILSLPYVIQGLLRSEFWDRVGLASWPEKHAAAAWLSKGVEDFSNERLDVAYDFEEIESRARRAAEICRHIPTYEGISEYVRAKGVSLPECKGRITPAGCAARARTGKWWRRKFLRLYQRSAEQKLRASGFVRRRRGLYASAFACSARRQSTAATRRYLEQRRIVSEGGEQLNLFDVWKGSVANPAIRRAELMTRMRGFEEISKELGHVAEFITLTCPSEYHPYLALSGDPNPLYSGRTVREAQSWLNKMWARARARLKKANVLIYGFRIAEPHHDGTPHWHMVLFFAPCDRERVCSVLQKYWLSESAGDYGATDHRITFVPVDPKKGSATGYISKYVAKNIDGFEVGDDYEAQKSEPTADDRGADLRHAAGVEISETLGAGGVPSQGSDATVTAQRVGAWASLHGIRQFQQIGGPQVTIYRECRRIREPCHVVSIERARVPADAGDWAGFVKSVGGIAAGRKGTLSLWTEITGECNAYDEAKGPQLVGLRGAGLYGVETHTKKWRIEKVEREGGAPSIEAWIKEIRERRDFSGSALPLGPVSITVAGGPGLSDPHGWTNPNETSMYGPRN